ncbi:hypothetical protein, partial [Bacillus smithii]|uniref:hypothetical protein n=1 Tax=Bacillus smithii TaxID=1479 RepID=UPI0022E0AC2D
VFEILMALGSKNMQNAQVRIFKISGRNHGKLLSLCIYIKERMRENKKRIRLFAEAYQIMYILML